MSYGAMLTDSAGVPFYIGDTMPLTLLEKRVLSVPAASGSGAVINLFNNDGVIRFVFVNSNGAQGNGQNTCEAMDLSGESGACAVLEPQERSMFIFLVTNFSQSLHGAFK